MFYTYLYLREDGTPYYVGKGKNGRAFTNQGRTSPAPPKERVIIQEFLSEGDAFEAEEFFIAFYGRIDLGTGCLRNFTDGGEGVSGILVSEKTREKMSLAKLGRKRSPHSAATKEKMRQARLHYWLVPISEQTRQKMRQSHLGTKQSQDHISKRVQKLRIPCSEEKKRKISASHLSRRFRAEFTVTAPYSVYGRG